MRKTKCAICETEDNSKEVLPATVLSTDFNLEIFSARRIPDRRHYRWVKCDKCELFRSDPVGTANLELLYQESRFTYNDEIDGLTKAYRGLLEKTYESFEEIQILEIGGGNGFMLEEALKMGFKSVIEVEPSQDAYSQASPLIQPHFIAKIFTDEVVPASSQDLVVMFHVLDHLEEPIRILESIRNTLKSRGKVLIAVHDVRSWSAKLFRGKSPIFDVEHTYLFSKETLAKTLEKAGFSNIKVGGYANYYSLSYLLHLLPIPQVLKRTINKSKFLENLLKITFKVRLGNIWAIGEKVSD